LPPNVRRQAERKLGTDLSDVRIHADGDAHERATALGAEAVTLGQDVYFRDGAPDATSGEGQKLYVHELTHVAQAEKGPRGPSKAAVSDLHSPAEREAAGISATGLTGTTAPPTASARGGVAYRHVAAGEEEVQEETETVTGQATRKEEVGTPAGGPTSGPAGSQVTQSGGSTPEAPNPLGELFRVAVDQRIIAAHAALSGAKPEPRMAVLELKTARKSVKALRNSYKDTNPLLSARLAALGNGITSVIAAIGPLLGEQTDITIIAAHTQLLLTNAAEVGSDLR